MQGYFNALHALNQGGKMDRSKTKTTHWFLALFVAVGFAVPLPAPACGDLAPDPATVPPVVRAPAL